MFRSPLTAESRVRRSRESTGRCAGRCRADRDRSDPWVRGLSAQGRPEQQERIDPMPKIAPCLWFDTEGEEAARFYTSVVPNSRITEVTRYGKAGPREEGSVATVSFSLDGQDYVALNGGPEFTFSEAISLQVYCHVPGRGRRLLGQADRGRRGGPVRLAEGPLRAVLADRADRAARADRRRRPRARGPGVRGDAPDEEDRHRGAVPGGRPGLNGRPGRGEGPGRRSSGSMSSVSAASSPTTSGTPSWAKSAAQPMRSASETTIPSGPRT